MDDDSRGEVTRLLGELSSGHQDAYERLLPLVYEELRRLASSYFRRERGDHTLQPTALVHEAYLKLVDQRVIRWESRGHFLGVAATLMRRILLDYARGHDAQKRGGSQQKVMLDDGMALTEQRAVEMIALDSALNKLAEIDPEQSRIVELRFFGGLSVEETAEVLKMSPATVKRYWNSAKAWLYREIARGSSGDSRAMEANPGGV
jgi:RNA polymerase sigma factor (TIGR02999 family)